MAIDSAEKRRNAAQVGCPLPVSVLPSGTDTAAIRYQVGWSYFYTSGPPPTGTAIEDRIMAGSQNAVTIREVTVGDWN